MNTKTIVLLFSLLIVLRECNAYRCRHKCHHHHHHSHKKSHKVVKPRPIIIHVPPPPPPVVIHVPASPPPPPPPEPITTTTTTTNIDKSECITCLPTINTRNIIAIGIWNTIVGGDCSWTNIGTREGNTHPSYPVMNIFDQNIHTYYINYGSGSFNEHGGINTGFFATLSIGRCFVRGFQFTTASNKPNRDPIEITIEGSNSPSWLLKFGNSWTVIYNGTSGLKDDPGRKKTGPIQTFTNSLSFQSYRVLVTKKRGIGNSVQYAEFTFHGDCRTDNSLIHTLNDKPMPIWNTIVGQDSSRTCSEDNNIVNIFDQDIETEYQNSGSMFYDGINTGFYVTLNAGYCHLRGFRFTTASDRPERDPIEVTIEGSNASSTLLTLGKSWLPIYEGSSGLKIDPGRSESGTIQTIHTNTIFNSYRVLITKQRGIDSSVRYSEVEFYGECKSYDEDGYVLNISKSMFVNGLSSNSVINVELIDVNEIGSGLIRIGDHVNVTAIVKTIKIAFKNYPPQSYSLTSSHNITDGFVTIHDTNSYIFLTFVNDFGEEKVTLIKLTGSNSKYKHGAETGIWQRKLEQHRQLFNNAFVNLDFSIIKHRIALSLEKTSQVPVTDDEEDIISRINFITTNATNSYINLIATLKDIITSTQLESTNSIKDLMNLKEIIIRNITQIQTETYEFILQDIENLPYNIQDSAADVFITNFEKSMHLIITTFEFIHKLPEQYAAFLNFPVPTKLCLFA